MFDLVLVGLVVEELDLGDLFFFLLGQEEAGVGDHRLAGAEDLLDLGEVVLLYPLK